MSNLTLLIDDYYTIINHYVFFNIWPIIQFNVKSTKPLDFTGIPSNNLCLLMLRKNLINLFVVGQIMQKQ